MMKSGFITFFFACWMLLPSWILQAETLHVPADYPTIQGAIAAASSQDTVLVAPGTYSEQIDFLGKAITVKSTGSPVHTIIQCPVEGSVVVFKNGEGLDSVLEGFTLTKGSGTHHPQYHWLCGGGIFCTASPTIRSNLLCGNYANFGTALFLEGGSPLLVNNIVTGNQAGFTEGGAVYCRTCRPQFTNDTIAWNGGVGLVSGSAFPSLSNCILWGDRDGEIVGEGVKVDYSMVQGGYPGQHNIEGHPLFHDGFHGDVHLMSFSPCKDAGNDQAAALPETDFEGDPRSLFDGVDMGADEVSAPSAPAKTIFVPGDLPAIQLAIDAALPMDEVLVSSGLYKENIDFRGKLITVRSIAGPETTIIEGHKNAPVVTFDNWETADAMIQGFTITNGSGYGDTRGGGIWCQAASPKIRNNIVRDNYTPLEGGGIALYESQADIEDTVVDRNESDEWGGGIYAEYGSGVVRRCTIRENASEESGGGICWMHSDSLEISECTIEDNKAQYEGGGVYLQDLDASVMVGSLIQGNAADSGGGFFGRGLLKNNIFRDNWANWRGGGVYFHETGTTVSVLDNSLVCFNEADGMGGGIYCWDGNYQMTNDTVAHNVAWSTGGGLHCASGVIAHMTNSVCWGNEAVSGPQIGLVANSDCHVSFSDVQGGPDDVLTGSDCVLEWGIGALDEDPLFADPEQEDFHLLYPSPCRDAGDSQAVTEPQDFEGDPRIAYGAPDLGADEFYPHLYHVGELLPGESITGKIIGPEGAAPVGLFIGSGVLDNPLPTPFGPFYLDVPFLVVPLWPMPASGLLELGAVLPEWFDAIPLQALVGNVLTNLHVLERE